MNSYLDLNISRLLNLLSLKEPCDGWGRVAGEYSLEPGPHTLLVPHLLDLADKLSSLLGS